MKAALGFDPRDHDYGPATKGIRALLGVASSIDWFEPTGASDARVAELFRRHQHLAHVHDAELFPEEIELRVVTGGREEFTSWCQRVLENRDWSWKFDGLKVLGRKHTQACGWSPEREADRTPLGAPRPGDLFFRFRDPSGGEHVVWNSVLPGLPRLAALKGEFAERCRFYHEWARTDATESITWQVAERSPDLTGNPFLPLLLCYRAGGYPFSLARDQVVLFRFARPA